MIASVCWVPKGASKIVPEEIPDPATNEEIEETSEISENEDKDEEMDDIGDSKEGEENDEVAYALAAVEALGKNQGNNSSNEVLAIADQLNELMKGYDKEDDVPDCIGSGVGNLYYASNDMDPHLQGGDDDEEEEIDDMIIKTTDAVIVSACTTEDEYSYLEVCVYEESEDGDPNMYTHQEKILSAYPLCTAWLDFKPKSGDKGNFVAVGSMEPSIEIWDLDLIKEEQPIIVLGGKSKRKKEGKKGPVKYKKGSHRDSVLTLAWNKEFRNVLASGSADSSVKVWNLETAKCVATAQHHTKEVQSVAWGLHSPELLLTGSFDQSVAMLDWRNSTEPSNRWSVSAVVESLAWDPHNEHQFVVSLKNGTVQGFDIRAVSNSSSESKPSFTLHAHDKAVTSISYNPSAPNLLATASTDKMVKLWDLSNNQPSCVASKNFDCGRLFSIAFSEDNPSLLAVGGKKGGLMVWDILSEPAAAHSFHKLSNKKNEDKMQTTKV